MELLTLIKFGYTLVIAAFLLMIWISSIEAMEIDGSHYPPCYFNSLCSCSKTVPDLGIVHCRDVHMPRIPSAVNRSKSFMLTLENNGLRYIEPFFLQSTGLFKLSITKNPLSFVSDEAFLGLERSLWELDLSYNQLTTVPNKSIRYLQKLRHLNLNGNDIIEIAPDDWRGLEQSLEVLILSNNGINFLPVDAFSGLPQLDTIDLTGNNLRYIDPSVFRDGMGKLTRVLLGDNQLTAIPYQALQSLKLLKYLDLGFNRINKMQPQVDPNVPPQQASFSLVLDVLDLEYNQISLLESVSFKHFDVVNKTYLDGNPIQTIQEAAFKDARIQELYIRRCGLDNISPSAFDGLENSLQVLDLSGNNISDFTKEEFDGLTLIRTFSTRDNRIKDFKPAEEFSVFQNSLLDLDLSGTSNGAVTIQDLKSFKRLRTLRLSKLSSSELTKDTFQEVGRDLTELYINLAGVSAIKNNAFQHVRGLRKLDLSENAIGSIETNSFDDVAYSLHTLILAHGLSKLIVEVPKQALKPLVNVEELDLSNNKLKVLPETAFHSMRRLRVLELHDNTIDKIPQGTFQGDFHKNLEIIYLSFNDLISLQQHTFVELPKLEQLHLDDNKIDSIERRAFMNLKELKRLNLKGNRIKTISYEAFQNLPELEDLDLSYNKLSNFEFSDFDQVGTLSILKVNASHNNINELYTNFSFAFSYGSVCTYCPGYTGYHSNIRILDFSFNNISTISQQFFQPAALSLTNLHMGHNIIHNATKDVFGNMPHLEWLDLSYNQLKEIDFDTFKNTKRLQVLRISHNNIYDIPSDLFRSLDNLRVVDFSHNKLRNLPENLFREVGLEMLDLSHNDLNRLHLSSMNSLAAGTLCELDLSWNGVSSISHGEAFTKFKSLNYLDLSYNRLVQVDDGVFSSLSRLSYLDLSHNTQIIVETGRTFEGIEDTLLHLKMDNVSLTYVPELPLPNLVSLSLASNMLSTIPPEMGSNISSLQRLNLDNNDLTSVPVVTHSLPELRQLSLSSNPIASLTNNSLLGVADQLEELDITELDLNSLETGVFCKMFALRTLKIGIYKTIKNFNIPRLIRYNTGLKNLEVHVETEVPDFGKIIRGSFPTKLRNITMVGLGVKALDPNMLQGIQGPSINLALRNTSVAKVTTQLFSNLPTIRNISLDMRHNDHLRSVALPFSASRPGDGNTAFLVDLKLSGSYYTCDCSLGWVETWDRKKRQYLCGESPNHPTSKTDYFCHHIDDDIRQTTCINKKNTSLVEVLKAELECGWSSTNAVQNIATFTILSIILTQIV